MCIFVVHKFEKSLGCLVWRWRGGVAQYCDTMVGGRLVDLGVNNLYCALPSQSVFVVRRHRCPVFLRMKERCSRIIGVPRVAGSGFCIVYNGVFG